MKSSPTPGIDRDKLLTSHEAGLLIQVNPSTINKWVSQGRLNAFRTPGGHRRIRARDLAAFLDEYGMPVPKDFVFAQKKKVLYVDDDERQLTWAKRAFKSHSDTIELATTTSGIDALLQVGSFRPNAIVLDFSLPDVDGLEVCRRLKANPETRGIEIIIASGKLTPAIRAEAAELGVKATLEKPFEAKELVAQLSLETLATT